MSDVETPGVETPPSGVPHAAAADHHEGGAHASFGFYIGIAVFLAIVTGIEIWLVSDHNVNRAGNEEMVRVLLSIASIAKFAGVVMFFMHLYYDRKILTFLFLAGLIVAACTMVALLHVIPTPINTPPDESGKAAFNPTPTPAPHPLGDPKKGVKLVAKFGCTACHNMPGNDAPASPLCPDQHGLATRAAKRVAGMTAEAYIRKTIETPNWFQVENFQPIMPPLRKKMTDQEYEDIVAYLLTLK